jgi:Protein of unknown function (DUF2752)
MAWSARPGIPALLISCVTFADATAARFLLRADAERVYVLGRPIEWVCALRSRFGLPCPTCGLTRSVVMSLHGEFGEAWQLAPVGPVVVFGMMTFAVAMLALAVSQWVGASKWETQVRAGIRSGTLIYAAGAAVIWLGGWAVGFQAALAAR